MAETPIEESLCGFDSSRIAQRGREALLRPNRGISGETGASQVKPMKMKPMKMADSATERS
jgi:hypothetical protein